MHALLLTQTCQFDHCSVPELLLLQNVNFHCIDYLIIDLIILVQNSINEILVRSFQLAFSLRSISLRGGGTFKSSFYSYLPIFLLICSSYQVELKDTVGVSDIAISYLNRVC